MGAFLKKAPTDLASRTAQAKGRRPPIKIFKLGIVSRDYRHIYPNGRRDFTYSLAGTLELLDSEGCDAALFSLYGVAEGGRPGVLRAFRRLNHLRTVFLEEYHEEDGEWHPTKLIVFHKPLEHWEGYEMEQEFATATGLHPEYLKQFVRDFRKKRVLGNSCMVICGEINAVKYSKRVKRVVDTFGFRNALPGDVNLILNPIHDRMTRFEMKLKRRFLSMANRWVVSVWNKGRTDGNGVTRDGANPPWTVFHNGIEKRVDPLPNEHGVEIGIVELRRQ